MNSRKRAVVLGEGLYKRFVRECGFDVVGWGDHRRNIDLVVFTGGTDVNPGLYNQHPHPATSIPDTKRDANEKYIYNCCRSHNIPMVGICRGAQLLCVMNGGSLIQHITGHSGWPHLINVKGKRKQILVTSTHHQMMQPDGDGEVIAWAERRLSTIYGGEMGGHLPTPLKEVEGVYWEKTKCLSMQWHPEYMDTNSEGYDFSKFLIQELTNGP